MARIIQILSPSLVVRLMRISQPYKKVTSAEGAIEKFHKPAKKSFPSSYVYVVDEQKHLIGVLSMHDLMLAPLF